MLKEPVIRKNIGKIGTNPDMIVKDGEIFLKQRNGNKVMETGLNAADFLK